MKQITTGTEITFKKTKEIYSLTQTETGFDVRQLKLSKNVQPEHWSFQEILDLYESGRISVEGFEETTDDSLIKSILTNYIHQASLKQRLLEIQELTAKNEQLTAKNEQLEAAIAAMQEA